MFGLKLFISAFYLIPQNTRFNTKCNYFIHLIHQINVLIVNDCNENYFKIRSANP